MSRTRTIALASILSAACLAPVQELLAQATLVPPSVERRAPAPVVRNREGEQVAGWAIVRYSVLADGSTDNVEVSAIAPPAADPDIAARTIEQWTFTPGTADGEAIDWHNNESTVLFAGTSSGNEAPPEFVELYDEVSELNDDEDFEDALEVGDELVNDVATSRAELGIALAAAAISEVGAANFHAALRMLRLATDPTAAALSGADLFVALQVKFRIEIQLGRTLDALATHERIAAGYGPDDPDPFASAADELRELWDAQEFIGVVGQIDEMPWYVQSGRRYFYIDNIEGEIDSLTAECDANRLDIPFQADADYQLPERFGNCIVVVNGEPGTSFTFVEVLVDD